MSPGGADELARMMRGIEVRGATGPDLGCGIGGYDAFLVERHGAGEVVGVDLDSASLEQAKALASKNGQADRLTFMTADATVGLPFDDATFDFVVTKDSIVDIPEKQPVFRELFGVSRQADRPS